MLKRVIFALIGLTLIELISLSIFNYVEYTFFLLVFIQMLILFPVIILSAMWVTKIKNAASKIATGDLSYKVDNEKMMWEYKEICDNLNKINEGVNIAVENRLKSEKLKTELITNVSHDIKTPLTSIINYVDLINKEETDNEKIKEYSEVLTRQSLKLKRLIVDLVEASKISSGNIDVNFIPMDVSVVTAQLEGEYQSKFEDQGLSLIVKNSEKPIHIMADNRHIQRIFDNLLCNALKYSLKGTRVYLDVTELDSQVLISIKNMSKDPLNINATELMDRFVRGDSSRHTEGNGLGLSIAQSLAKALDGKLEIVIDGDLFKANLIFDRIKTTE